MSGGVCTVKPIYKLEDHPTEAITRAILDLLANSVVTVGDGQIGAQQLNTDDLLAVVGAVFSNQNLYLNGNFIEPTWETPGGKSCAVGAKTFNAYGWWCRPAGAQVTYERTDSVPTNKRGLHAVKITGASSVNAVDFGQDVKRYRSASWRTTTAHGLWIYNGTGAAFTPVFKIDSCDAADNWTTVTNRVSENLQECANGVWTKVSLSTDLSSLADIENGVSAYLQIPSGNLDDAGKYVIVAQFKGEPGSTATTIGVETPVIEQEGVSLAARELLDDEDADVMLSTLGGTAAGKEIFKAGDVAAQRSVLEVLDSASVADGRLSLSSSNPIPTTNLTAQTTLYYLPYIGRKIALYDSSNSTWGLLDVGASGISLSLSGLSANTNYDVFAYNNSGTPTLEVGSWASDTTRSTPLTRQDGVLVSSAATSRRYLGTIRITGTSGQCEDSSTKRYVWNANNRVRKVVATVHISSHTYTTGSWREWNNSSSYRLNFVAGEAGHLASFSMRHIFSGSGGGAVGFGFNSIAGPAGFTGTQLQQSGSDSIVDGQHCSLGLNYLTVVQAGSGSSFTYERFSTALIVEM